MLGGNVSTLVAVVGCISAFAMIGGLASPLLSLILESRGVGRSLIGFNAAMPAFGTLIASPFVPSLARHIGIRRLLIACLLIESLLFLALWLFDHLYSWFLIRLLMGASTAALFICSETWINTLAPEHARGRIIATYTAILAACMALGPTVVDLRSHEEDGFSIVSFVYAVPLIAAGVFVFAFIEYTSFNLLSVFGVRSGLSETVAIVMLSAFGFGRVFLQIPIGYLADRVDRDQLLIWCVASAGFSVAALPFVTGNLWLLAILLFLWGGFVNGINTVSLTLIGQRFRGSELATASAGVGALWGVASLIGPAVTGVAMDLYDPDGFVIVMAFVCVVFVVGAVRVRMV